MANTRTAYRWNVNGWFFKTIEVAEDPDFPGEYTLPTRSTWSVPMDDTETQWPKINTSTLTWELTDLSMAERLAENLITQEEYDTWYAQKDGQFLSVLKNRADSDANNIALISDVEAEAETRANADIEINASIENALVSIQNLSDSLIANSDADNANKVALEQSIFALEQTTQALLLSVNGKADANHSHSRVDLANRLATARKIGNASFDGSADISLAQMGVEKLIASAVANAGSGITVSRSGRETVIRDPKNKLAVKISLFKDAWTSGLGCQAERDFDEIIGAYGSCSDDSGRVRVDWDLNELMIEADHSYNFACLVMIATLK